MGRIYDIENLLVDIKAFLVANLNTKLTAIDSDKADSITLAQVDSSAYFFQNLSKAAVANYNPFVLYGIDEIPKQLGIGPATIKEYTLFVIVVLTDSGNDPDSLKRLLRYQRALTELFEESWNRVGGSVRFKVSGLVPIPLSLLDDNRISNVIGVNLDVALS